MSDPHFSGLERMYRRAPVNAFYRPSIEVRAGQATISIEVDRRFFHAAGAVHGSVYFKLLDDAAYFAANSLERERFVLTASFTTYFTRPVTAGTLIAEGRVVDQTRSQLIADATLRDGEGNAVGHGNGIFVRGRAALRDVAGYLEG